MRLAGHKLTLEWSGEHGAESSSTGRCTCGWEESCSNQREVRREYRLHLERAAKRPSVKKMRIIIEAEAEVDQAWYDAHLAKAMNEAKGEVWHALAYPLGSSAVRVNLRTEAFEAPAFEQD